MGRVQQDDVWMGTPVHLFTPTLSCYDGRAREVTWFQLVGLARSTGRQSKTIAHGCGFRVSGRHAERLLQRHGPPLDQ